MFQAILSADRSIPWSLHCQVLEARISLERRRQLPSGGATPLDLAEVNGFSQL